MKLYEINAEILRLTDAIEFDEETGEILGDTDEMFAQIQLLQMEKNREFRLRQGLHLPRRGVRQAVLRT